MTCVTPDIGGGGGVEQVKMFLIVVVNGEIAVLSSSSFMLRCIGASEQRLWFMEMFCQNCLFSLFNIVFPADLFYF